nr:PEP-CTERM sorting domain-containing protein [Bradyrhizobium paxllaeri]
MSGEILASQAASFYSAQVGTYYAGTGSCGKNCSYPIYYPIYGTLASYNFGGNTGELFVPMSFTSGAQTYFGFIDLVITNSNVHSPYNVVLKGYEYDNTGARFAAGSPLTPTQVAAVPEPSTWALMALGFVGLALYRRRANSKSLAAA